MPTPPPASSATASWWPPPKKSASGASSTGAAFPSEADRLLPGGSRHQAGRRGSRGAQQRQRAPIAGASSLYVLTVAALSPSWSCERLRNRKRARRVAAMLAAVSRQIASTLHAVEHHLCAPRLGLLRLAVRRGGRLRSTASAISASAAGAWGAAAIDRRPRRVYFPHSLGVFYKAMTQSSASRTTATNTR